MSTSCLIASDDDASIELGKQSEFIWGPISDSVWQEVERLYSSVFSSKAMLTIDTSSLNELHAWQEKTHQKVSAIFLFRKQGRVIVVANEVIRISAEEIKTFSKKIFDQFSDVRLVRFHSVILKKPLKKLVIQSSKFSEDYILTLKNAKENWILSMPTRVRGKLQSYLSKALDNKNRIQFYIYEKKDIDEKDVGDVIRLNQSRMRKKNKTYGMTFKDENRLCEQLNRVGLVFLLKKDNEICAGLLCSVVGKEIYLHVLAHDSSFDKLRLGLICCLKMIDYVNAHNFQGIHFLWGHYDYKKQLGARPIDLNRVLVIKNRRVILMHPIMMAKWYLIKMRDILRELRHKSFMKINS